MQSVPITTKIEGFNQSRSWRGVLDTTYVIKFVCGIQQVWFSAGTPVSSTNKTDCNDITVVLN